MPYTSVATTRVSVSHPKIPTSVEWSEFSGGKLTHANQTFFTQPFKEKKFPGRSTRENITLKAATDPVAHAGFIKDLNAGEKFENATIKVESVDASGSPIGGPDVYTGCMVAGTTPRQANNGGEDIQMHEVEWEVPAP